MKRRIAAVLAAVMLAGMLVPAAALAAERRVKSVGPDGQVPAKWDLAKPNKTPHPDVAPPSASGSGDGFNRMSFTAFGNSILNISIIR